MKTRTILLWVMLLIITDQIIKLIINQYFPESHFSIIPALFEFKPVFNDKHTYLNSLMNRHFGVNIGLQIHLVCFFLCETTLLILYSFLRSISSGDRRLLDLGMSFQIAGVACSLMGNLIWKNGTLDYIYLNPLFVFDMKDLYLNCFAILLLVFIHKNRAQMREVTVKDLIFHIGHQLKTLHLGPKQ
ncbi:MAG: signal peptidase II [Tannerellaceae bacterium]|nr:signal peptidase II [Tannerellaceae bacterium]